MLKDQLAFKVASAGYRSRAASTTPSPKVGDAIFEGTDYPTEWDAFVGQERAVQQLRAACYSARFRQQRCDHVLLASGVPGIGKTSLAKLVAKDLGTGIVEVAGQVGTDEARLILSGMSTNDVLFIDEIHQMVSGGKVKAEWLLHVLQDGVLMTKNGPEPIPDITIIGATTDAQKLPATILGRFPVKPVLEPYSEDEAAIIGARLAGKLGFGKHLPAPSATTLVDIARASNCQPRDMRMILIALRDAALSGATSAGCSTYDLAVALDWAGYSEDGLTRLAQDYIATLLVTFDGQAGEKTIGSALGEPGPLRHTEQLLVQKSLLSITANGRQLTPEGVERAVRVLQERGLIEDAKTTPDADARAV